MVFLKHSKTRDKKAVGYHYDVSNNFYQLFLDKDMIYSCAYFKEGNEDIDQAQQNKLEYICRKLRLKPGERLLDVGCGWGGLIIYAAKNYGIDALGITLSQKQYEYAKERIKREGLADSCRIELRDYREIEEKERFDKIVSVGMFEHVGIRNLPIYFKAARGLLKEKGLFLNHGITTEKRGKKGNAGTKFINTYVFPDGELANISYIQQVMEEVGFEILDVEALRAHYARTLRRWTTNLQAQKEKALKLVDEKTYRIWLLYMAGCSYGFEKGNINVYQVLLSKNRGGFSPIPLTRGDLYMRQDAI